MMKTRNLIVSFVALVVVVGIIVVSNALGNRKPPEKATKFFPGLTRSTISAFTVADASDTVRIYKKGDVWMVGKPGKDSESASAVLKTASAADTTQPSPTTSVTAQDREYPADSASVTTALDKLESMKKDVLISENPEKQTVFEVDSAKGLFVEVWDGKGSSAGSLRIGKNGPDWSSHYVRALGSNKVYSVSGSIRYSFFSDAKRWRDKSIVKFDKSLVKKLVIAKQGSTIELEKQSDSGGTVWMLSQPEKAKAKSDEIDKILDEFSRLSCAEWQADTNLTEADLGLAPPELTITVELNSGDRKTALIGKKKEAGSQFWVKTVGKDHLFLVSDFTIQKFDINAQTLRAQEETKADSTKKS